MRVLVTGAAGFVGQHLVRELLRRGDRVFGGTLDGAAPRAGTLSPVERDGVHWVSLDVRSGESLQGALRLAAPDAVYHLAGQSSVGNSFQDPLGTWEVNATGTLRLLEALRAECADPVRVLLTSSAEVYGDVPEREQPITERRLLRPGSPYAASKAAAEMAVLQACDAGGQISAVIARSFNHTGPGQDRRFVLPNFAHQLAEIARGERDPVLHVGNLDVRRDFLDVREVVDAYLLLVAEGQSDAVYNVCSGEAYCLGELVEELVTLSGTAARIVVDPDRLRKTEVPLLRGDPSRLRSLGWVPKHGIRSTLADLLRAEAA